MFNQIQYYKKNNTGGTEQKTIMALAALIISIQPGALRAQGVQDNLERIDKAELSTPSSSPVPGFAAARPGPAPLFPASPHGAGALAGMAPS